jgi:hypothetical protein
MELILKAMLLAGAVICAWAAYKVIHEYIIENRKGTPNEPEPPYKIEPPASPEHLAISIAHKSAKRRYTKSSKYWSSTKVKNKMSKARKARKSSKSK